MKRRLIVLAIIVATLTGGASAASAGLVGSTANGYWACAGVRQIDTAVCLENPLPERLVPES